MNKPNNYDTISAGGFTPVTPGGHICDIKEVIEMQSKAGAPMVRVNLDFSNNDSQPGYFKKQFADDIRPEKKWPNNGGRYILTEDRDGNCSRAFKQFITCWEKSNGTTIQWGAGFAAQFVNTKIGAVYGEVENEYNGKTSMRREVRWFCPVDEAAGATAPEPKYLSGNAPKLTSTNDDSFVELPKTDEPDLPFN